MKQITVTDEKGKKYTLEYTKNTIVMMERGGFVFDDLDRMPVLMTTRLYQGAFLAHHQQVKTDTIEKIVESLKDKKGFLKKLGEMYVEQSNALVDEENEGNAEWEANF